MYSDVHSLPPPWVTFKGSLFWPPGIHSCLLYGQGRSFTGLAISCDIPLGELIIHLVCYFLPASSRFTVCEASPAIRKYTQLRIFSSLVPDDGWQTMRIMAPISEASTSLSKPRACQMLVVLLLFNFKIGDLIWWLRRSYTHTYIPMDPICTTIVFLRK